MTTNQLASLWAVLVLFLAATANLAHAQNSNDDIAKFNEAIRLDRGNKDAWIARGNAWIEKKEYDKAIADFIEAIRLDPKNADPYKNRAWLWATCVDGKVRDGKKAVESATKACELTEWKRAADLDALAAAYAEAGDFDAAVEWQSKAIELYDSEEDKEVGHTRLKLYQDKKPSARYRMIQKR